jgi:DnaJ-domain-containing protein 1
MSRSRADRFDDWRPAQPQVRACDHADCAAEGQFRAPRSRDHIGTADNYYWFCLEHVRAYNAAWNYYQGMSEPEIERELRQDSVWQRPTWPLGWRVAGNRWRDPLNLFREDGAPPGGGEAETRRRPMSEEEKALIVFDLEPPFDIKTLKTRYKLLVKLHHPDANGGDKDAEERLKIITHAYALLKTRYFS